MRWGLVLGLIFAAAVSELDLVEILVGELAVALLLATQALGTPVELLAEIDPACRSELGRGGGALRIQCFVWRA